MQRSLVGLGIVLGIGCGGAAPVDDAGPAPDASTAADAATTDAATPDAAAASDGGLDGGPPALPLPPPNGLLDYQLGGAYAPPTGVEIVARDRTEAPAPGLFNVCYVNGFQIQPGEESFWLETHPDLVLRDAGGDPVIDADWDEMLIDVGTPEKRARVAEIVGGWIRGCARDGFDAVEIDNLDSFTRSAGLLDEDDAVAQMRLFADAAHAAGLAIAQKNSAEIAVRRGEMGTDFAVSEECNRYAECDVYTAAYGEHVLVIEYRREDFTTGCAAYPGLSIVLRDVPLSTPGSPGYVYEGC
jgi:hypothetical protein